ncbi:hypothetical protein ACFQ58_08695 [Agromyces sp. NPDC056523]|uniref:hypothetical protein n=1 Tax=Agromyces sp. NPDC056523 TaxID=3345850 RepID=UPI00366D11F9
MASIDHDDDAEAAAKLEHTRELKRRWRQANLDRLHEQSRAWKAAHPERVRELNRRWREEHLDRSRQQNRDSARRAAARKRREADTRRKARERAKRWREEHPERVRAYQQRWVEANRDKVREYYNRYYATHRDEVSERAAARRDADPERSKQVSREWAERNKERRAELQRRRRSDPEIYQAELEANAAARRLKRRLARAGLPPKRIHPTTAADRRANESEAAAYFDDPKRDEHLRQFSIFAETLKEYMVENGGRMMEFARAYAERRDRLGLPPVDVNRIVESRAVEVVIRQLRSVDLLTSRDIAAAVRSARVVVQHHERHEQLDQLVRAIVRQVEGHRERLTSEAALEIVARRRRGRESGSLESILVQLAAQEVVPLLNTSRLTTADARAAGRAARARIAPLDVSSGAYNSPHQYSGQSLKRRSW